MSQRILVVDDEPELKDVLSSLLRIVGHEVIAANNGREALELIKSQRFDLVISDVRMAGGGGLELVKELQAVSPKPPVILISGFTGLDEKEAHHLGILEIFYKPFNVPDFLGFIERYFKSRA